MTLEEFKKEINCNKIGLKEWKDNGNNEFVSGYIKSITNKKETRFFVKKGKDKKWIIRTETNDL